MKLLGAVLAGGQSSRFGSDKALARYRGTTLLDHAIASARAICDDVIVCGRKVAGIACIGDRPSGTGPLGALNAALSHAQKAGFDAVLTIPCDAPTLTGEMMMVLRAEPLAARAFADLPVCGCWPVALAERLDDVLRDRGAISMRRWIAICEAETLAGPGVANVNRPEDLAHIEASNSLIGTNANATDESATP